MAEKIAGVGVQGCEWVWGYVSLGGFVGVGGGTNLMLVPLVRHLIIKDMLRVPPSQELPSPVLGQGRHVTLDAPRLSRCLLLSPHPLPQRGLVLLVFLGASEFLEDHLDVVALVVVVVIGLAHQGREIVARGHIKSAWQGRGG